MTAPKGSRDLRPAARAFLSPEAAVTLHDAAAEPLTLEHDTVQNLFALGVQLAARDRRRRTTNKPRLTLEGHAQFLVGHVDLGRKRGLRAVRDGLEHCIGAFAGEQLQTATAEPDASHSPHRSGRDPASTDPMPEPAGLIDGGLYVERSRAGDNFDAIVDLALGEGIVVLTRHGAPQLVLLAWEEHCLQRERDAQLRAAYWSAVRTGERPSQPPDPTAAPPGAGPAAPQPDTDEVGSGHDR
ncbi:hypothetical protein CTKZ_08510 [Cellulomonas algicola]|uniref:Prevent-host-death family protein n=1 Tax=Cellulomonas algicola TaxID=2071633 RepID=A0A401UX82_9CELL|nr:hypothetical protein [Cellulomonas algicola]GCD19289.1 hypothetical protein CTKZ_08510 [Cellulomonas algicola]